MKKLSLLIAIMSMSALSFANNIGHDFSGFEAKSTVNVDALEASIESIENVLSIDTSIDSLEIVDDICTVTVTVTSGGRSASATATNYQGDCEAAASAAEITARYLLAIQ